ncbi:MAG TPA: hypothetical protein DCL44_00225 [Elusimicrobia bacterium]|nr:hypothetical protein [Elusimicrobiota bacterium]
MTPDQKPAETGVPLVSIVVPVYNAEATLEQCVESVLSQTYRNTELILVDDGSTDAGGDISEGYGRRYDRIKSFHCGNGGPSAARNYGINKANGELLFFLDADDYLPAHAISSLVENYSRCGADMVVGDFQHVSAGGQAAGGGGAFAESRLMQKPEIVDYAFAYLRKPNRAILFAYSWGRLFKTSIIRGCNILFNPELHTFEDVAFNFDYLKHARTVSFVKQVAYEHRICENYSSATMTVSGDPKKMFGYRSALKNIRGFLEEACANPEISEAVGHANVFLTIIQLVRICGQINASNKKELYGLVREVISDPGLRRDLLFYRPSNRDSRLIPLLIRLRLAPLVVAVCRHKAAKRYGRGFAANPCNFFLGGV